MHEVPRASHTAQDGDQDARQDIKAEGRESRVTKQKACGCNAQPEGHAGSQVCDDHQQASRENSMSIASRYKELLRCFHW